jgi:hypothetical protein
MLVFRAKKVIGIDKRKTFIETNLFNILKFIYNVYSNQIHSYKSNLKSKIFELQKLNEFLFYKKQIYRNELDKIKSDYIDISDETFERYLSIINKHKKLNDLIEIQREKRRKIYADIDRLENRKRLKSFEKEDLELLNKRVEFINDLIKNKYIKYILKSEERFLNYCEFVNQIFAKENPENIKLNALENRFKFWYFSNAINSINNDIEHINILKKDFKKMFNDFDINLSYDLRAKITLYDIKMLKKKVLTSNTKRIIYFYLRYFKRTHKKQINYSNDFTLNYSKKIRNQTIYFGDIFKALYTKEMLENQMKKEKRNALKDFTIDSINKRLYSLENNIIKKWI